MYTHSSSQAARPRWISSKLTASSTSPKLGKASCARMRSALTSPSAPPSSPASSTTAVAYQVVSVSSTASGWNTWMWLPRIERLGKTLMFTGSGRHEIERPTRFFAELLLYFLLEVIGTGDRRLLLPQRAGALLDVGPLVLEVMAVREALHVHRRLVGLAHVEGHALVGVLLHAVFHLEQRAMREHDVIAVGGVVVGELPVALVLEPVRLGDDHPAAGMPVDPLVDRLTYRHPDSRARRAHRGSACRK